MSFDVRRLAAADAPALRAMRIEAFTLHPREFRSTPAEEAARPLARLEVGIARDNVLGLFDGEALVGAAGLAIEARAKLKHKATIRGVFVRPTHRGQGGAERLLRALLAEAARREVEAVHLVVSDGNGPALRLYTRLGFAPWAFEPRALRLEDGSFVDEITMVRRLTEDDARDAALQSIKRERRPLPADFKFDREEANER
ncbi:MAG: GNAT family N-acetyltransferase [Caulobacteraceae bacterium]